jgi:ribonucleoside-diphosphate reductase alpha chain
LTWQPPTPLQSYQRDYSRPEVDWTSVVEGIEQNGIRNAAQTTIAPTGTIATVSGCEGYGCEPVFALAYMRHVNDGGKDLTLTYSSPLFENALAESGLDEAQREVVIEEVLAMGSCQDVVSVPEDIQNVFAVSGDISAEEHVRMQGALQAFVDNSLSKTVNFPEGATEEDVATAYELAWELGSKGITVYVTGSRDQVVLETKATAESKEEKPEVLLWNESKKARPNVLQGVTHKVDTPLGKAFVTLNENGEHQPFEAFITTAKAGSETAAVSEAIGRLISYILRLASPVSPRERLKEVRRQLTSIGGDRQSGFGPNRVRSFPDGVSQALNDYLVLTAKGKGESAVPAAPALDEVPVLNGAPQPRAIGELCPECGNASLVNEEACRKCYTCGFSEC